MRNIVNLGSNPPELGVLENSFHVRSSLLPFIKQRCLKWGSYLIHSVIEKIQDESHHQNSLDGSKI